MSKAKLSYVHISQIVVGDTIKHCGEIKTISGNNLKRDSCMGTTLFGDSYNLGNKAVEKVIAWTN